MYYYRLHIFLKLACISIYLFGCSHNSQKETYNSDQSLLLSTQVIEKYTTLEYDDLKSKLFDPSTAERANRWYPTAEKIKSLTTEVYTSIDSCLKYCEETNFDKCKSALKGIANNYKNALLLLDPELVKEYGNEISLIIDSTYFKEFTSITSIIELHNKIYNSISLIANRTISFCNLQTSPGCILRYEKFSVLIGQNSKHFKVGDKIEVTAGVGSFSSASQPLIIINNQKISINDFGYAEFKKVITGDTGKHIIPIKISYYSPDGIKKETTHEVEYFISQ